MGFLAPAVPWIAKGGAALGSALFGGGRAASTIGKIGGAVGGVLGARQAQKSAMGRSPEEQEALTGAKGAATALGESGTGLVRSGQATTQEGLANLEGPSSYWSRLLGGNRASMAQATAAPRAAITDIYSGAARGLERSNVRGAARDVAKAELGREQASKIAGLTTGVQPEAARQLADLAGMKADIGAQTSRTGASMATQGADIFANLLGQGFDARKYGRAEGEKSGKSIGGLIFDVISGMGGSGKNTKGIPTIASRPFGGIGIAPPPITREWAY